PWLYHVANRLALAAKTRARRRRNHEAHCQERPVVTTDPVADITLREARAILDEELLRLPERLRAPLVLCHLEGATRDEAARQLGWSFGPLRRRLEKGRELLRQRLVLRGLSLSSVMFPAVLGLNHAAGAMPVALAQSAIRAAGLVAAGAEPANVVSGSV